ncbi:MAG: 8-oxoguanine deaminase [Pseudomonadota bacterium]
MAERLWLRQPRAVYDPLAAQPDTPVDVAGGLVVDVGDGRIVERIPAGGRPSQACDVFDARGLVLLPGLINTHHHFYQTLTRAYDKALNKPLFGWLTSLYPVWQHLTDEMIDVSTRMAVAELLLSGATTVVDHHYVFSATLANAIDTQAAACAEMGIRAILTRGSMSLGASAGGLPPDAVVQGDDEIMQDSERLIARWHDAAPHAMCQIVLAPCSPFSVRPELLRATADLAARHGVGLHTHLAETHDEDAFCMAQFGARPVDHLEGCGWLRPGTWFAHGIHFQPQEIARLGAAGVGVAHCPTSNMMLGSGICCVSELQRAGVAVGLGVDGSASNDHSNLIQEARAALYAQRLRAGLGGAEGTSSEALFGHLEALRIATRGGAELLGRDELGSLSVGSAADLALYALDEPRFSGAQNALAALLLSGAHRACDVMVRGRWRVRAGRLVGVDLRALQARHDKLAHQLWDAC